jgi:hypothetical protein
VDAAERVDAARWRLSQRAHGRRIHRRGTALAFDGSVILRRVVLEDSTAARRSLGRVLGHQLLDVGLPDRDADALLPSACEVGDRVHDLRAGRPRRTALVALLGRKVIETPALVADPPRVSHWHSIPTDPTLTVAVRRGGPACGR